MVFASIKSIVSSALSLFPRRRKSSQPSIIVDIDASTLHSKIESGSLTSLPLGFLHWNFSLTSQSKYTFHSFTFTESSLGITINVRRPYSAIVSALRELGKHSGLKVGDVIVSIGGQCPRQWLDMVAQQLLEAERPLVVEIMRVEGENEVIKKALSEPSSMPAVVHTKAPRILSPQTEFAITQASSFSRPSVSSIDSPGKKKSAKSAKSAKKGKGKTPAKKGGKSAKARQAVRVNDGTPSRKLKKTKSKAKKR
ncbi:hypothetical protein TrCOL_g2011 [Triparma columacea]|uniref:PDZ domain-containing protein n=1 Tax=Triparma columacea TaxID=722753 RepID=A0A9W7L8J1_9STRA|nr:hypothetical protein TrCOL_g2011 [Triparma columacea]